MKTKSDVLRRFKQLLSLNCSESTVRQYSKYVAEFLDFCDNVPLRVTNEDFLNFNISLVDRSDSYRNGALNAVKKYFKLILNKKVKDNIAIRPRAVKRVVRPLDYDITKVKIKNVANIKHRLILLLGLFLGLRRNEVLCLKNEDVHTGRGFLIVLGKGKKERELPLNGYLIWLIDQYRIIYSPSEYLIEGQSCGKYSGSSILNLVKKHVGDYTFHQLRHTFGQNHYDTYHDIYRTSVLMGHAKVQTTADYYVSAYKNGAFCI